MPETGRHFTNEVLVTPEMIEAGVHAYYSLGDMREAEDAVILIFEAMTIAGRRESDRA